MAAAAALPCEPLGLSREALPGWREQGFPTDAPDAAALAFLDCLGQPDPFLRDRIAYEGLTTLLRGERVSVEARRAMLPRLLAMQAGDDAEGFAAPFAALALAEVVRTDRISPYLEAVERTALVDAAGAYLRGVSDYRGYVDGEGWRHGVAHGADLVLQLVLNPAVSAAQQQRLLAAVAAQVTPPVAHAYIHGEPQRLARPVLYAAYGGRLADDFWSGWFAALGDPAPLENWQQAFTSERELARLHNLRAFARAVLTGAVLSDDERLQPLAQQARGLLETLP
jgi:hypothetical protein